MSDKYEPKVGDRVKITHEGVVTKVSGDEFGLRTDDGNQFWFYEDEVMKVEKVSRTFRPGTVAIDEKDPYGDPVIRTANADQWRDLNGNRTGYTDAMMHSHITNGQRVLKYEPPA